jgi:hypothetical protein
VNGHRAEVICKVNLGSEKGSSEAEGDEEEAAAASGEDLESMVDKTPVAAVKQVALWAMAGVYTCWLFLLPYAPVIPRPRQPHLPFLNGSARIFCVFLVNLSTELEQSI